MSSRRRGQGGSNGTRRRPGDGASRPARKNHPTSREVLYGQAPGAETSIVEDQAAFAPAFDDLAPSESARHAFAEVVAGYAGTGGASVSDACEEAGQTGERDVCLGRVIRLDRGYPLVLTAEGLVRAEHAVSIVKADDARAAVGDWVALARPDGHDKARIAALLPRTQVLARWDGGSRGERQVLAANVDLLVVVQPLGRRDIQTQRIARSIVLGAQGGMAAAVVLTKCDRAPDVDAVTRAVERVRAVVGPQVPVIAASSVQGSGVEEVRALVGQGTSALLLGESGAGKSTLINALLGEEVLASGSVRDKDDAGRHTTVARRMLKIPGAGVLVDAPGLRSIALLDEEAGLARAFPEIDDLVCSCRFRDCTHGTEPGCAVRDAVAAGTVGRERLDAYRALAAEMIANRRRLDPSAPSSITG